MVLIDTQWNVNEDKKDEFDKMLNGFNRYIVECKFNGVTFVERFLSGFNRYIVECK